MRPRNDDEEWEWEEDETYYAEPGRVVLVSAPRPTVFTGLYSASGRPIYKVPADKPPVGFRTDPDLLHLYDLDPDEDFFYSDEVVLEPDTDEE